MTSLTFDLTSDQEKLPAQIEKKGKKHSGEQQRRIPLPKWTEAIDVMCHGVTTHSMNMKL